MIGYTTRRDAIVTRITEDSSYPDIAEWADYYLHARASDADALQAFGPRDGRSDGALPACLPAGSAGGVSRG